MHSFYTFIFREDLACCFSIHVIFSKIHLLGHYMYIETSSPRVKGDKALLNSPMFKATSGKCMEFFYHMYGGSVDTLNVYIKSSLFRRRLWGKSGDQGQFWQLGQVSLSSPVDYQVVFEGIRGQSYQGDIAIDDVTVYDGGCRVPGDCDFERGLCSWSNTATGDDFDWLQGQGNTNSQFTGPQFDHTLQSVLGKINLLSF